MRCVDFIAYLREEHLPWSDIEQLFNQALEGLDRRGLSNAMVRAFEIDQQSRLERMYPGLVQRVNMPDSQELMDDELVEGRALSRVYHALRSPRSEGLLFLDIGANYDERVAHGLLRARLSRAIAGAGRKVCVLVPLDGVSDTITAAASAIHILVRRTVIPFSARLARSSARLQPTAGTRL